MGQALLPSTKFRAPEVNIDERARVIFNRKLESAESKNACWLSLKFMQSAAHVKMMEVQF